MKPNVTTKGYILRFDEIIKAMGIRLKKKEFIYSVEYNTEAEVLNVIVSDAEVEGSE